MIRLPMHFGSEVHEMARPEHDHFLPMSHNAEHPYFRQQHQQDNTFSASASQFLQ